VKIFIGKLHFKRTPPFQVNTIAVRKLHLKGLKIITFGEMSFQYAHIIGEIISSLSGEYEKCQIMHES